jgi:sugar diacid utilization regulator
MASNARMNADMVRASARVAACASEGELGEVLCEAIIEHLGFERVATYRIGSAEELELRRTRGWDSRELLVPSLPVTAIKRLVSGEGERSGTSLVHASALFPEPADGVRSRRNGRGAFGWNDGCLLVPIRQGADELTGVIVVEDPVDHRLPSDQQRNLLRLLADQTAGAWLALQMRAFQARLLGLMLAREGAPSLAQVLADTVRAPVALLDWSGQPVARAAHESRHVAIPNSETLERHRTERPPQYADPREPIVRPLELGDQVEGYLVVERSSRAQPIREMAVDQAVTTFALQLAMISNAEEVEHRMLGTLVDELLDSDAVDLESLARRAERLGYSLDALTCAIAVEPLAKPELFAQRSAFTYLRRTVRSVLEEAGCGAVVAPRGDTLLALITDPTSAGHREIGHQLVERAQIQTGLSVAAGISRTITDPSKLAQAVREAQQALEAARTVTELAPVALAGELDLHSLLLSAPRSEELKRAAVRLLSPLVEGRGRSSDLLTTLETYLDAVGHLESTAQRLGIHINTLRNRLRRIESLLGLELRDARARVDLQLALELAPADELGRDGAKLNGSARQPSRRTGL